ncbi:unnamed protein product [Amoebophrya sp. A120]|nr:unnamed protein product [Amoebophrya sp. A120]|eukprot:GSA120T00001378001.1
MAKIEDLHSTYENFNFEDSHESPGCTSSPGFNYVQELDLILTELRDINAARGGGGTANEVVEQSAEQGPHPQLVTSSAPGSSTTIMPAAPVSPIDSVPVERQQPQPRRTRGTLEAAASSSNATSSTKLSSGDFAPIVTQVCHSPNDAATYFVVPPGAGAGVNSKMDPQSHQTYSLDDGIGRHNKFLELLANSSAVTGGTKEAHNEDVVPRPVNISTSGQAGAGAVALVGDQDAMVAQAAATSTDSLSATYGLDDDVFETEDPDSIVAKSSLIPVSITAGTMQLSASSSTNEPSTTCPSSNNVSDAEHHHGTMMYQSQKSLEESRALRTNTRGGAAPFSSFAYRHGLAGTTVASSSSTSAGGTSSAAPVVALDVNTGTGGQLHLHTGAGGRKTESGSVFSSGWASSSTSSSKQNEVLAAHTRTFASSSSGRAAQEKQSAQQASTPQRSGSSRLRVRPSSGGVWEHETETDAAPAALPSSSDLRESRRPPEQSLSVLYTEARPPTYSAIVPSSTTFDDEEITEQSPNKRCPPAIRMPVSSTKFHTPLTFTPDELVALDVQPVAAPGSTSSSAARGRAEAEHSGDASRAVDEDLDVVEAEAHPSEQLKENESFKKILEQIESTQTRLHEKLATAMAGIALQPPTEEVPAFLVEQESRTLVDEEVYVADNDLQDEAEDERDLDIDVRDQAEVAQAAARGPTDSRFLSPLQGHVQLCEENIDLAEAAEMDETVSQEELAAQRRIAADHSAGGISNLHAKPRSDARNRVISPSTPPLDEQVDLDNFVDLLHSDQEGRPRAKSSPTSRAVVHVPRIAGFERVTNSAQKRRSSAASLKNFVSSWLGGGSKALLHTGPSASTGATAASKAAANKPLNALKATTAAAAAMVTTVPLRIKSSSSSSATSLLDNGNKPDESAGVAEQASSPAAAASPSSSPNAHYHLIEQKQANKKLQAVAAKTPTATEQPRLTAPRPTPPMPPRSPEDIISSSSNKADSSHGLVEITSTGLKPRLRAGHRPPPRVNGGQQQGPLQAAAGTCSPAPRRNSLPVSGRGNNSSGAKVSSRGSRPPNSGRRQSLRGSASKPRSISSPNGSRQSSVDPCGRTAQQAVAAVASTPMVASKEETEVVARLARSTASSGAKRSESASRRTTRDQQLRTGVSSKKVKAFMPGGAAITPITGGDQQKLAFARSRQTSPALVAKKSPPSATGSGSAARATRKNGPIEQQQQNKRSTSPPKVLEHTRTAVFRPQQHTKIAAGVSSTNGAAQSPPPEATITDQVVANAIAPLPRHPYLVRNGTRAALFGQHASSQASSMRSIPRMKTEMQQLVHQGHNSQLAHKVECHTATPGTSAGGTRFHQSSTGMNRKPASVGGFAKNISRIPRPPPAHKPAAQSPTVVAATGGPANNAANKTRRHRDRPGNFFASKTSGTRISSATVQHQETASLPPPQAQQLLNDVIVISDVNKNATSASSGGHVAPRWVVPAGGAGPSAAAGAGFVSPGAAPPAATHNSTAGGGHALSSTAVPYQFQQQQMTHQVVPLPLRARSSSITNSTGQQVNILGSSWSSQALAAAPQKIYYRPPPRVFVSPSPPLITRSPSFSSMNPAGTSFVPTTATAPVPAASAAVVVQGQVGEQPKITASSTEQLQQTLNLSASTTSNVSLGRSGRVVVHRVLSSPPPPVKPPAAQVISKQSPPPASDGRAPLPADQASVGDQHQQSVARPHSYAPPPIGNIRGVPLASAFQPPPKTMIVRNPSGTRLLSTSPSPLRFAAPGAIQRSLSASLGNSFAGSQQGGHVFVAEQTSSAAAPSEPPTSALDATSQTALHLSGDGVLEKQLRTENEQLRLHAQQLAAETKAQEQRIRQLEQRGRFVKK